MFSREGLKTVFATEPAVVVRQTELPWADRQDKKKWCHKCGHCCCEANTNDDVFSHWCTIDSYCSSTRRPTLQRNDRESSALYLYVKKLLICSHCHVHSSLKNQQMSLWPCESSNIYTKAVYIWVYLHKTVQHKIKTFKLI
jgi:hypothetical protein